MDDGQILAEAEAVPLRAAIGRILIEARERAIAAETGSQEAADAMAVMRALRDLFPEETVRHARASALAIKARLDARSESDQP